MDRKQYPSSSQETNQRFVTYDNFLLLQQHMERILIALQPHGISSGLSSDEQDLPFRSIPPGSPHADSAFEEGLQEIPDNQKILNPSTIYPNNELTNYLIDEIRSVNTRLSNLDEGMCSLKAGQLRMFDTVESTKAAVDVMRSSFSIELKTVKTEILNSVNAELQGIREHHQEACEKLGDIEQIVTTTRSEDIPNIQENILQALKAGVEFTDSSVNEQEDVSANGEYSEISPEDVYALHAELLTEINDGLAEAKRAIKKARDDTQKYLKSLIHNNVVTIKQIEAKLNTVKHDIVLQLMKCKHDLYAFTEKEVQLVLDRTQNPSRPRRSHYRFDMYLPNFSANNKTNVKMKSPPWRIEEAESCVKGLVSFSDNGSLIVELLIGRKPYEAGLLPRQFPLKLNTVATIKGLPGVLSDIVVGREKIIWNEDFESHNTDKGVTLGSADCDTLIKLGYGEKDANVGNAVLISFDVNVSKIS